MHIIIVRRISLYNTKHFFFVELQYFSIPNYKQLVYDTVYVFQVNVAGSVRRRLGSGT